MYDRDAMGVTITKRNGTTERNNHDEYTNYYNKATYGYFNDMSENGIVFYILYVLYVFVKIHTCNYNVITNGIN